MSVHKTVIAHSLPQLLALGVVAGLFFISREPVLTDVERTAMAARFRFESVELPDITGLPHKSVRTVHPSLRHIDGMISFVGAAVAIADLDDDGLPNDLVHVDPRTDQVTVGQIPGASDRFKPFVLDPSPLDFDPATMAPMGCLIGDLNEDGLPDILVYYWGRSPIVFLRKDGGVLPTRDAFVATELITPVGRWYTGAVTQADFDGDGHVDLIVGNYFPDESHILDAHGTGVEQMPDSVSRAFNGGRKRLFLWQAATKGFNPTVTFRPVEGAFPAEVVTQWTFGFAATDLDGDLLPELYCVHDWGQDRLLHNRSKPGQPRFAILEGERTMTAVKSKILGFDTFSGMGVDVGDLNGDELPDIFVSNITAKWGLQESNFAFLSTGGVKRMRDGVAPYRDESERIGLSRGGWTWEARFGDFDNDGVLEVMQAAGFLKGAVNRWPEIQEISLGNDQVIHSPLVWSSMDVGDEINGHDRNPFFVRSRDGRYFDLAEQIGIPAAMLSRGIATADVDGDGRLDFVVANQWGPSYFFRNTAAKPGAFLGLHLRLPVEQPTIMTSAESGHHHSAVRCRAAIGAQAKIHLADGRVLVGEVDGGTGHSGKRSPDLHFGLGPVDAATTVLVDLRWRGTDGQVRVEKLRLIPGWHTVILSDATPIEGRRR